MLSRASAHLGCTIGRGVLLVRLVLSIDHWSLATGHLEGAGADGV
ncbi:MAG: hypothetical protein ACYC21_15330 [Eubacteriales bacterium]